MHRAWPMLGPRRPTHRSARGLALVPTLICVGLMAGPSEAADPDNFLIILADDVGVDKVGAYLAGECVGPDCPSPPPTPNIDALAARGVLFRHGYANPVCSPTRVSTLVGRHAFRNHVGLFIPDPETSVGLDPEQTNLATALKTAGYETAAFGKWHAAGCPTLDGLCTGGPSNHESHPIRSGFDYFAGSRGNLNNNEDYCDWQKIIGERTGPGENDFTVQTLQSNDYATTDTVDEAVGQIQKMGEPWLAWVAFHASHTPLHVVPADPVNCTHQEIADKVAMYDAMTEKMDQEIGRMFAEIESSSDVLDRTTIVLVGDNGTVRSASVFPFPSTHAKGSPYEGGINVPFIVAGPHVNVPVGGDESAALVHVVDIFGTVMEIAGIDPCSGGTSCAEDSVSFLPHLANPALTSTRSFVFSEIFEPNDASYSTEGQQAVRGDRYKLIRHWANGVVSLELFDLQNDPFEQTNLLLVPLNAQETQALADLGDEMNRLIGVCPTLTDADTDCIADVSDNCPTDPNGPREDGVACGGNQLDDDNDLIGNVCDPGTADVAHAAELEFVCNVQATLGILDFDAIAASTLMSSATILVNGETNVDVEFPPAIDDPLDPPGPNLDLQVVADSGDNPSLSGTHTLGPQDPLNFDTFASGTELQFSFDGPVSSFGISIISPEKPGVELLDQEIELQAAGLPTAQLDVQNRKLLGNFDGADYYAYFLGIIAATPFSSATLTSTGAPTGAFMFNVDDLILVPEPHRLALLVAGWLGVAALGRLRRGAGRSQRADRL